MSNPFLGMTVERPAARPSFKLGPISFGLAPVVPHILVELAAGLGTVRDVAGGDGGTAPVLFDYRASAATSDSMRFASVAAYRLPGIPELQLAPRTRFVVGYKPVEFPVHPRFNKRFMLLANGEEGVRPLFTGEVLDACAALPEGTDWQMQAGSGWLLLVRAKTGEAERAELARHGERIAAALRASLSFRAA